MSHIPNRPRPIVVVGLVITVLAFAAFIAARLVSGQLIWLNAWRQPVSVFLVFPVLAVLAVVGLLSHFVWRPSRKANRGGRERR
jgi:hypothetical protein